MRVSVSRGRVKAAMKAKKLTFEGMGKEARVRPATVSEWCDTEFPLVEEVANALGCHPIDILDDDESGDVRISRVLVEQELSRIDMSVQDLADRLGMQRPHVYQLVYNRKLVNANRVARLLGVNAFGILQFGEGDK